MTSPPEEPSHPAAGPERTSWVGRARLPAPPPVPVDPYWPPVEQVSGYTEPYPVYLPRRRRSGTRVLLVVAGLLAACCAGGATLALLSTAKPGTATLGPAPPGLNTVVKDGRFDFVVTSVSCGHQSLGTLVKVTAKGQYCVVDLSVTNTGTDGQTFTEGLQKALDAQGNEYGADSGAGVIVNMNLTTLWSVVNPGATITGKIVYDIPEDARIAKLELHDALFSGGVTVTVA